MPIEYKLVIIFVVVGASNVFLRSNRNWIFGYRSTRSLKSHDRFAYANVIFGVGMMLIGIGYFIWLYELEGILEGVPFWQQLSCVGSFLLLLFLIIEIKLTQHFKE